MKLTDINFDDIELFDCAEAFEKLDPIDRLSMNHAELAEFSEVKELEAWKRFLKHPAVADYLKEEIKLFTESQKRKLITTVTDDSKSTGLAQMIGALDKTLDSGEKGDNGQLFIYSYVPMNKKEEAAPNARREIFDIFNK